MSNIDAAKFALDKAKIGLLSKGGSPFLATILFGMKHRFDASIPTLATSGLDLIINPTFFLSIPEKQREAELCHECWHVALDHIPRLYERDMERWNYATDYAINIMMHDSGRYQMDDTWLLDEQYRGMTADQIYELLQSKPNKKTKGGGQSSQAPDHMFKPENSDGSSMSQSEVQAKIQQLVAKAAVVAQQQGEKFGYAPGGLEFLLEPILNPKLNWKVILMNYVSTIAKNDYSYRRFNKRYLPNFYMPTLYSEEVGEVAVAFDASCSVSDRDFRLMLGQLKAIQMRLRPKKTTLITFDTKVQNEYKLTANTSLNSLSFTGRGGTCVECVFEHFNKRRPKVLIVFSDMEFSMPDDKPNYPVIWIGVKCTFKPDVTFGKYIEFTE